MGFSCKNHSKVEGGKQNIFIKVGKVFIAKIVKIYGCWGERCRYKDNHANIECCTFKACVVKLNVIIQ